MEPLVLSRRPAAPTLRGPVFDTSLAIAAAAVGGSGVALLPLRMFDQELAAGRLVRPFGIAVDAGSYWLTRLRSRAETPAMRAFRAWLQDAGAD